MRRPFRAALAAPFLLVALLLPAAPAGAVTIEKVTSPGGIEAWLVEDHSNPIIDLELAFRGGASVEPEAKAGLAYMVSSLLDEGAGPYDSQTFQGKLDDLAIELGFDSGEDNFHGHLKTLTRNRDIAFDLFRLALTRPRFDKEPVERIRSQILTALARQQQSPEAIASLDWFKTQFAGHPYAVPVRGTPETVNAITVGNLRSYVKAHLARDNLLIGVVGDITPAQLAQLLDATFGTLPAKAAPVTIPDIAPVAPGRMEVVRRHDPQTVAIFGQQGLKRDDPDWYAAYVMNYILGGGDFSSWLTEDVREKHGLAYSVYSILQPMEHTGIIFGSVATENSHFAESVRLIRQEWARMRDQGPTQKELDDAKTFLTGAFALQLDSTTSIADLLVTLRIDRLGIDYIDRRKDLLGAVTLADVRRVAKRLLHPEALAFVVVGEPEGITPSR
ncbi:MAG: pitrilysin family protein [Magnetospirillum sp.]|nr:pitrilysin family protein [Magnetospirillum sp.]